MTDPIDVPGMRSMITHWLTPLMRDPDDLADLTQDCLIKMWVKRRTFRGEARLQSWAYRIVRNEFVSWTRKERARRRYEEASARCRPTDKRTELAQVVVNRVAAERLLSEVSPLDRRILELRYFDDLPTSVIGPALDLSPSSVRCRIMRLRTVCARARDARNPRGSGATQQNGAGGGDRGRFEPRRTKPRPGAAATF